MNNKGMKLLAAAVVVLAGVYFLTTMNDREQRDAGLLMPGLKQQINDVSSVAIASANATFTLAKNEDRWTVVERDGYAANMGQLRTVLLALADAKIVERKTSKAENYAVLGVDEPTAEGSSAIQLSISGEGFEHTVIVGKTAQANYRYARLAGEAQSVLINQNPDMPATISGWLDSELLDIAAAEIKSVSIEHADGEQILLSKESAEDNNFSVSNVPDGRELSYPTVANGIGGALAGLQLEDVRKLPDAADPDVSAVFDTFDNLSIVISTFVDGEEKWVSIAASEGSEQAAAINARLSGWQYRLPQYKGNLLTRRFEDLLKAETTEQE